MVVCDQDGIDCSPAPANGDTSGVEAIIGRNAQGQPANIFGVAIRSGHVRGFTFGGAHVAGLVSAVIVAGMRACDESGIASTDAGVSAGQVVQATSLPGVHDRVGIADARGHLYVVGGRLDPAFGNTRAEVFVAAIAPDGRLASSADLLPLSGERTQHVIEDRIYQVYRFQGFGPAPSVRDATPVVFLRFE